MCWRSFNIQQVQGQMDCVRANVWEGVAVHTHHKAHFKIIEKGKSGILFVVMEYIDIMFI